MKKILLALFITSPLVWAEEGSMNMHHHSHEGHLHDKNGSEIGNSAID